MTSLTEQDIERLKAYRDGSRRGYPLQTLALEALNTYLVALDEAIDAGLLDYALRGMRDAPRRMFPIQRGPSVPYEVMAPHEAMSQINHDQSIQRIAERGG